MAMSPAACADDVARPGAISEPSRQRTRYGKPRVVGRIQDPAVTELSGLGASARDERVIWGHNDSGGSPAVYCIRVSGESCGTWPVHGAGSVDWEDIAGARALDGSPSLFIGDIGDNDMERPSITVYRIPEPRLSSDPAAGVVAERFELTYPDGPHDAESLAVHPTTGDIYIVTKAYSGRASVYVARAPLAEGPLERVASFSLDAPVPAVTGADITPSGRRVILSTYGDGYELQLPRNRRFDSIWKREPLRVDLGTHAQLEAVTYTSSRRIVSASEGEQPPIYAVERRVNAGS